MTRYPPETRFDLEVRVGNTKDHIVVYIYDKQETRSYHDADIYPPGWWDKLLGRSWDDKVCLAIVKTRVKLEKLRKEAKRIETLVSKAEEIVKQFGKDVDGDAI
jgi:hypothetical protein